MKKNKVIIMKEVNKGNYYYEYAQASYKEGIAIGILELENAIFDDVTYDIIGYFGINWEHNIMAYYFLEECE